MIRKNILCRYFYSFFYVSAIGLQFVLAQPVILTAEKEKSEIHYLLIHPLHKVEAVCKDFSCTIQYNDATRTILSTSFNAEVSSFDSGNSNRNSHAMEVLDALTYPTVSFQSKDIKTTENDLLVDGDLTFHGVTKPVTLTATMASSGSNLTIQGKSDISLTLFKIERPSLLFMPVQDTLRITFTMEFNTGK